MGIGYLFKIIRLKEYLTWLAGMRFVWGHGNIADTEKVLSCPETLNSECT